MLNVAVFNLQKYHIEITFTYNIQMGIFMLVSIDKYLISRRRMNLKKFDLIELSYNCI
jgi:hypothetical protein